MEPVPGAPSDNTTLLTELQDFRERGYGGDFIVEAGPGVRCTRCEHRVAATDLDLDALRRLEGASDPDDMVALLALTCPDCGSKGTALVHYGPNATQIEDELLLHVEEPAHDDVAGTPEKPER